MKNLGNFVGMENMFRGLIGDYCEDNHDFIRKVFGNTQYYLEYESEHINFISYKDVYCSDLQVGDVIYMAETYYVCINTTPLKWITFNWATHRIEESDWNMVYIIKEVFRLEKNCHHVNIKLNNDNLDRFRKLKFMLINDDSKLLESFIDILTTDNNNKNNLKFIPKATFQFKDNESYKPYCNIDLKQKDSLSNAWNYGNDNYNDFGMNIRLDSYCDLDKIYDSIDKINIIYPKKDPSDFQIDKSDIHFYLSNYYINKLLNFCKSINLSVDIVINLFINTYYNLLTSYVDNNFYIKVYNNTFNDWYILDNTQYKSLDELRKVLVDNDKLKDKKIAFGYSAILNSTSNYFVNSDDFYNLIENYDKVLVTIQ